MTVPSDDELIQNLVRRGVRATTSADWTQQMGLDMIRENRRRYAGTERAVRYAETATWLIEGVRDICDVPPDDMASVLLSTSALIGTLALLSNGRMSAQDLAQILAFAADDLDRAANGGEQK